MTARENVPYITTDSPVGIVAAGPRFSIRHIATVARFSVGRIVLHLLAMVGDRCVRFHVAGMTRELPWSRTARDS
jgi:hypothetical protein